MKIPNYLSYYFRNNQEPFQVLSDLDEKTAQEILKSDVLWRGDGTYLVHRKKHEECLRNQFIAKGGRPQRQFPIYAILGESPIGPHDLENEYYFKIHIPIGIFTNEDISFTYPDSLYEVPLDDLHKLYLNKNREPILYMRNELESVIKKYQVYEINNHYIEAQIWNSEILGSYSKKEHWGMCKKR